MYAVGVGNAVEDELKEIASEPTGEHYFYTADFKAMTQIAKKLQINICQGQTWWLNTNVKNTTSYFPVHADAITKNLNLFFLFPQRRTLANVILL